MKEELELSIEGMTCTACAARIEKKLNKLEGIHATVNYATEKAVIEYEPVITEEKIIETIVNTGYQAHRIEKINLQSSKEAKLKVQRKNLTLFIVSTILTLPLVLPMVGMVFGQHWDIPGWIQFLLSTPVQFWIGARFYMGAFHSLKSGGANMDVLVALGTTMAYLLSTYLTFFKHSHHLYFESAATVITLVFLGKLLEERAKNKSSSSIESLLKLQPEKAILIQDDKQVEVDIAAIQKNNIIFVKAGESIPVDGEIIEGISSIDESMLTGESVPVDKTVGEEVYAGTINQMGNLKIRAKNIGEKTFLHKIVKLVESAMESKAPIQKLADKVSGIFVPAVIGISLITLIGWYFYSGNISLSIINAVTVLVISCPCALGLATPTAIMVGSGKGAELGILIKDAANLEKINHLKAIVFDKTGTLTEGKLKVDNFKILSTINETEFLQISLSIGLQSNHPVSKSIVEFVQSKNISPIDVKNFDAVSGKGIRGEILDKKVYSGSDRFMKELNISFDLDKIPMEDTVTFIAMDNSLLGYFTVRDTIRKDSIQTVQTLKKMGIEVWMISGDGRNVVQKIANELGIEYYKAEVLPSGKSEMIEELKQSRGLTGMVGDGINDALALATSDISFSMATGTGIAIESSDVTLIHNRLLSVPESIELSKAVLSKIKQNLFFAFIYNIIGIPLAAFGILSPVFAGAAMAFSSVSVISNSLLLKKWRKK